MFYDLVWYWHKPGDDDNPRLGRWLGVAKLKGSDLCYWVLEALSMRWHRAYKHGGQERKW
jgi:hypothetical protein